jgi:hypothetical protein
MHDMHIGFMNLTVCQSLIFTRRGPHIWSWTGTEGVQCTLSAHIHMHAWWLTWSRLGSPRPYYYLLLIALFVASLLLGTVKGRRQIHVCMDTTKLTMHHINMHVTIYVCVHAVSVSARRACARDLVCFNSHSFSWPQKRSEYIYMIARTPVHAPLF